MFYLFADDTKILYADKNMILRQQSTMSYKTFITGWLTANKLTLSNVNKSTKTRMTNNNNFCVWYNRMVSGVSDFKPTVLGETS